MRARPSLLAIAVTLFAGCGSSSSNDASNSDADAQSSLDAPDETSPSDDANGDATDDAFDAAPPPYPAFLPNAPQEKSSSGGLTIAHPRVVPVFFPGDADRSTLETFLGKLAASSYWKTISAPYGIDAPVISPSVAMTTAAPASMLDPDLQTWLQANLDGTHADWGAADPSAVYMIFFPATTTFGIDGATSCHDLGGYHSHTTVGSTDVVYAAIPRCASFLGLTGIDVPTIAASHELVEAATDPFWDDARSAFAAVDDDHFVWELEPGAEVGDLCDNFAGVYFADPEIGAKVERIWSNDLAAQGHLPCAPRATDVVYFNAIPTLDESVTFTYGGSSKKTKGVKIPVGTSKTIDVPLLSDAPTSGPWKVTADTVQETISSLAFSFDRDTGVNGDVLHLTITAKKKGAFGGTVFELKSTLAGKSNFWMGFVAN